MHYKRRTLSIFLICVLVLFSFWGSGMEMSVAEEEPKNSFHSDKETIYFWYNDEALTNYINSAAVSFGEREDVRVIPVITSKNDFLENINEASLNDSIRTPDAYIINNDSLEKAYLAGLAVPVEDDGILNINQFPRTALSAVLYEGKYVAFPMYFETSALLYNKTYLDSCMQQIAEKQNDDESDEMPDEVDANPETEDENGGDGEEEGLDWSLLVTDEGVPLTLDGLLQISNAFDAPPQIEVVFEWNVSDIFFNYWFVGSSMVIGTDSGDDHSQIDIFNDQTVACLETYQNLNQFFSIQSDKITADDCIRDFIDGKVLFTLASSAQIRELEEAVESGEMKYEYAFANLPELTETLSSRTMSVTNTIAVNGYSAHKELANRFAYYLVEEYNQDLYDRTGKISANGNVTYADENVNVFFEEYKRSISLPKMMEIGNLWLQLEAMFSKIWNGAEVTPLVKELDEQIRVQLENRPQRSDS